MNRHPEAIRGEEILASGEAIRYDELHVGDRILGVGAVTHVHIGNAAHIEAGGHRFSKRADLKVTIAKRATAPQQNRGMLGSPPGLRRPLGFGGAVVA
jgi:hypothetical protein